MKNITINIPEDLSEITLHQYQLYNGLTENIDDKLLLKYMVSIFCNVDVNMIPFNEVKSIAKNISNLLNSENDLIQTFKMGDIDFGLIPNLEKMSYGEFIDLEKYISEWKTFHLAMAVLYRPITKRKGDLYDIEEYEGTDTYGEFMKQTPMNIVFGVLVFFYHLGKELLGDIQRSLEMEMKILRENPTNSPQEINLIESGDGTLQLIHSLAMMLQKLKPSLNSHFNLASYK